MIARSRGLGAKGNQTTQQRKVHKVTHRSLRERMASIEVVMIPHCWAIEEAVRAKSPVTAKGAKRQRPAADLDGERYWACPS